jgi:hypothetical protein
MDASALLAVVDHAQHQRRVLLINGLLGLNIFVKFDKASYSLLIKQLLKDNAVSLSNGLNIGWGVLQLSGRQGCARNTGARGALCVLIGRLLASLN